MCLYMRLPLYVIMCMGMHVSLYLYIQVCVLCNCIQAHVCVYTFVYAHVCTCVYTFVYTHVCKCVFVPLCM